MLSALVLALALQQIEAPAAAPPPPAAAKAAPARKRSAPAAAPKEAREEPTLRGFDAPSGKRYTGELDDEDVGDAIRAIAEAAGWSVVLPAGRLGAITANLRDVPVEEALAAVLAHADLVASRQGSIVTIRARTGAGVRAPGPGADDGARDAERPRRGGKGRERGRDQVVRGDAVVRKGAPARDVVALGGSVRVEAGAEARDVVAVLGSVVLEPGARARQAVAVGGHVRLGAGAEIEKDAVAVGGEVHRDEGAQVGGDEVGLGIPVLSGLAGLGTGALLGHAASPALSVGILLAKFLVYFAVALLALALFPRRLEVVAASFAAQPGKAVLTGLFGAFALPIVAVLLVATIVGIPLVAVLAVLAVAAGALGFAAVAFHLGRMLPPPISRATAVLRLAAGTGIVVLVTAIPVLGGMVWVAAALLGFGAVLRSRFGSDGAAPLPTTFPPPAAPVS